MIKLISRDDYVFQIESTFIQEHKLTYFLTQIQIQVLCIQKKQLSQGIEFNNIQKANLTHGRDDSNQLIQTYNEVEDTLKPPIPVPFSKKVIQIVFDFLDRQSYLSEKVRKILQQPHLIPRPIPLQMAHQILSLFRDVICFDDLDLSAIQDIMNCANFLVVKPLIELCCIRIASIMQQTKSVVELRNLLKIECDLAESEIKGLARGEASLWGDSQVDLEIREGPVLHTKSIMDITENTITPLVKRTSPGLSPIRSKLLFAEDGSQFNKQQKRFGLDRSKMSSVTPDLHQLADANESQIASIMNKRENRQDDLQGRQIQNIMRALDGDKD